MRSPCAKNPVNSATGNELTVFIEGGVVDVPDVLPAEVPPYEPDVELA